MLGPLTLSSAHRFRRPRIQGFRCDLCYTGCTGGHQRAPTTFHHCTAYMVHAETNLPQIVQAHLVCAWPFPWPWPSWRKHGCQNGDDGDHTSNSNQRKAAPRSLVSATMDIRLPPALPSHRIFLHDLFIFMKSSGDRNACHTDCHSHTPMFGCHHVIGSPRVSPTGIRVGFSYSDVYVLPDCEEGPQHVGFRSGERERFTICGRSPVRRSCVLLVITRHLEGVGSAQ